MVNKGVRGRGVGERRGRAELLGEMHAHRMRRPASGPERKLMDCPIIDAVSTPSTPSASSIAAFCLFAKRRQSQIETTHDADYHPLLGHCLAVLWAVPGQSRVCDGSHSAACRLCCRLCCHLCPLQVRPCLRSGVVIGASSRLGILLIKLRKFTIKSIYYYRLSISRHYTHPSAQIVQPTGTSRLAPCPQRNLNLHLAHGYRPPTVVRIVLRPLCSADRRRART